jgi:hypothetical protein
MEGIRNKKKWPERMRHGKHEAKASKRAEQVFSACLKGI